MRTIGQVLREARVNKNLSFTKTEKETKIKKEFVKALEAQRWEELPDYPVVSGFVKSLADIFGLDRKQTLAKLRRDYPPKNLRINPKPDVADKFTWSPRLTFLVGVLVFSLIVISYLTYQYYDFISPPKLEVLIPKENEVVTEMSIFVKGTTEPQAIVRVNNQPVIIEEDGSFSVEIEIFEGTSEIEVKAVSRSGKETVIRRRIIPELESTRD